MNTWLKRIFGWPRWQRNRMSTRWLNRHQPATPGRTIRDHRNVHHPEQDHAK